MEIEERDPQTGMIIGAAIEVLRELGHGFVESVYHGALAQEFARQGIPFEQEKEMPVYYKGMRLDKTFKMDFVCYSSIVVELKALSLITGNEEQQLLNYLKGTKHRRGLLLNFGTPLLGIKRMVFDP